MAIVIEGTVEVKTPDLAPTVGAYKALKQQIKEAKDELANLEQGTVDYAKKAAEIGELTNKVGDLNKSISAVSGQPMENLTGSFSLLTNQVKTLDIDGVTSSFKSLWTTIAANPFIAIASAIGLLIANWEKINELLKEFGVIQKTTAEQLQADFDVFKVNSTIRIKQLEREIELQIALGSELKVINELRTEQNRLLIEEQKRLIAIEEAKIADIKASEQQRIALAGYTNGLSNLILGVGGDFQKNVQESSNKILELNENIQKLTNSQNIQNLKELNDAIAGRKEKIEDPTADELQFLKTFSEEKKKIKAAEKKQNNDDINEAFELALQRQETENFIAQQDRERKKAEEQEDLDRAEAARVQQATLRAKSAEYARQQRAIDLEEEKKLQKEKAAAAIEGQKLAVSAISSLSGLLFNIKRKNLEKGSKEEEAAAKEAFELEKGVQIGLATINGIQAGLAAFAAGSKFGPIVGAAYAAAAAVVSIAQIAKIKNAQFVPGSGGAGVTDGPGIKDPVVTIPQTGLINAVAPTTQGFQASTGLNPDGTPVSRSGQLTVSEGEMTEVQGRVQVLEGRARF